MYVGLGSCSHGQGCLNLDLGFGVEGSPSRALAVTMLLSLCSALSSDQAVFGNES